MILACLLEWADDDGWIVCVSVWVSSHGSPSSAWAALSSPDQDHTCSVSTGPALWTQVNSSNDAKIFQLHCCESAAHQLLNYGQKDETEVSESSQPDHLHQQVSSPSPGHQEIRHCASHSARLALQTRKWRTAVVEETLVCSLRVLSLLLQRWVMITKITFDI